MLLKSECQDWCSGRKHAMDRGVLATNRASVPGTKTCNEFRTADSQMSMQFLPEFRLPGE